MSEIRVLEAFGEPIADGGQESFVFGTLSKMNLEGIRVDCLTAYECRSEHYKQLVEQLGGNVYALNLPFAPGKSREMIRKPFREFLKKHHYDVIHVHSGSISVLTIMASEADKAGTKKVIVHSHVDGEFDSLKHKLLRFMASISMSRHVDIYCACSKKAAEWKFEPKYVMKTHIIKNGIDTEKFAFNPHMQKAMREKYGLTDAFVIGHVGRFSYQKNHAFLIDVFENLYKKDSSVHLLLVGAGEEMDKIKALVKEKGIGSHVTFIGTVTNVQDYLQAMDVFVLPSRFEGLGIVAIEAQCAGLPVIASDTVPIDAKVKDVDFLPLSDSPDKWADEILKYKGVPRTDNSSKIKSAGFDARHTAEIMRRMYMR